MQYKFPLFVGFLKLDSKSIHAGLPKKTNTAPSWMRMGDEQRKKYM